MNFAHTHFHVFCKDAKERHLTLLNFGNERDEKRRKEIKQLIEGYEYDIELTKLAIRKLREDLARLDRRRG